MDELELAALKKDVELLKKEVRRLRDLCEELCRTIEATPASSIAKGLSLQEKFW